MSDPLERTTSRYMPIPITETTRIAAQVTSKRSALALSDHHAPERAVRPAEVLAHDRADQAQRGGRP